MNKHLCCNNPFSSNSSLFFKLLLLVTFQLLVLVSLISVTFLDFPSTTQYKLKDLTANDTSSSQNCVFSLLPTFFNFFFHIRPGIRLPPSTSFPPVPLPLFIPINALNHPVPRLVRLKKRSSKPFCHQSLIEFLILPIPKPPTSLANKSTFQLTFY